MQKNNKIKMTFNCNQDWDAMKITTNGRFCDVCKHDVIDYSEKTINEINKLKLNSGLCGMFRAEQIEQELVPIEFNFIKKIKYFFATVATLLGLELTQAHAQSDKEIKMELAPEIIGTSVVAIVKCDTIVKDDEPVNVSNIDKKPFLATNKNKYYWSKKFPFIIKRRKWRSMGRF